MTRSNDTFYSLQERVNKGATAGADLFISVHGNANDATSANGTETYYDETYQAAASKRLAGQIQPKVVNALKQETERLKQRHSMSLSIPKCLVY